MPSLKAAEGLGHRARLLWSRSEKQAERLCLDAAVKAEHPIEEGSVEASFQTCRTGRWRGSKHKVPDLSSHSQGQNLKWLQYGGPYGTWATSERKCRFRLGELTPASKKINGLGLLAVYNLGWTEGSAVKDSYSCGGPGFNAKLPHRGSQPSVTPFPRRSKALWNSLYSDLELTEIPSLPLPLECWG